jgi:hypothetical protein
MRRVPRPATLPAALFLAPLAAAGATITVTSASDTVATDGAVTLREAILSVNAGASVNADVVPVGAYGAADAIHFAIPGTGVRTISPASPLPQIAVSVELDATTQPGFSGPPRIELDGSNAGAATDGLQIVVGAVTVRGFVIKRFGGNGVFGGGNFKGNYIGTDSSGMRAAPNGGSGLFGGGIVGGSTASQRNVVSGNRASGIVLIGNGGRAVGNYVGVGADGATPVGNGAVGVEVVGNGNTVGGLAPQDRNVIANNTWGVVLETGSNDNVVQGNLIGWDLSQSTPLPNSSEGIIIGGSGNRIGGESGGAGNAIAFTHKGISTPFGTGNTILANSIVPVGAQETSLDLGANNLTPNDACDVDTGANNLQNFPVLTEVTSAGGSSRFVGVLETGSALPYRIEFFASPVCGFQGHGPARIFLGAATVSRGAVGCAARIDATLPVAVPAGHYVTATATDAGGNTSELSACVSLQTRYHTVAPCRAVDTRGPAGLSGGPALAAQEERSFPIAGQCGVPAEAKAVAFNFTTTQATGPGDIRVYPKGLDQPLLSTLNYRAFSTRANNAVASLGPTGEIAVYVDQGAGTVHLVIDVTGYFE